MNFQLRFLGRFNNSNLKCPSLQRKGTGVTLRMTVSIRCSLLLLTRNSKKEISEKDPEHKDVVGLLYYDFQIR